MVVCSGDDDSPCFKIRKINITAPKPQDMISRKERLKGLKSLLFLAIRKFSYVNLQRNSYHSIHENLKPTYLELIEAGVEKTLEKYLRLMPHM